MSPSPTHVRGLCLVALLSAGVTLVPSAARSQDRPPDNATAARIADGVEKARAGKLLDAVEQFQRVLDQAGDELVPVDGRHHALARWVVYAQLARLPAEGLRLYRRRVDEQAAKRLIDATAARDDAGLHRLLADMFPSTAAEEAILELGRRAFERAEFDAAEHFWRMLLPPEPDDDRLLRFPTPKTDAAAVKAWLILVKLFRGERADAQVDLKAFAEKHPTASGLLAGKTGKYVQTLTALAADPEQTTIAPVPERPGWPTFAGSPSREGTTRTRLPYFWPDYPAWRASLPFVRRGRLDPVPADALHPRALAFHPVVAGGRAYVADGTRVLNIDLMSGQVSTAAWHNAGEEARIPTRQDVRYTLTEADGTLYARFGPAGLKAAEGGAGGSFLVALGLKAGTAERDVLWRLDPPAVPDATTHFEGAPVVDGGRLYVGLWRQAGGEPTAGVACYRLDDPKAAPELVWQRLVGKSGSEPNGETRYRHSLVTVSGSNVVCATDAGSVVALDARTGQPAWEYRYPRNERPTLPRYRDLSPPLADGGRVYAAPADTDRLLCLDAFTGQLIWQREGVEVVHLLGVAKGRLIATFGGQVKGIRGLNLRTGADSGVNGWTIHDDGGEMTFGRGLVSEAAVVWPTRHGLHFLDPADGTALRSPIRGSFGNLCYADGVLLVTTATEVWGYVSEAKKLGDRRKAVEADPDNPVLHAELTQSLIDAGRHSEAEQAMAKSAEAKERLRWLLAEKVIRDGDREGAKRLYGELAKGDRSFAAGGAVRLAEMVHDPAMAREAWRVVAAKGGVIRDEHGIPHPAPSYAEIRFGQPLTMRNTGFGDFRALDAEPHRVSAPVFRQRTVTVRDDPSLRVLGASAYGILAAGRAALWFGDDGADEIEDLNEGIRLLHFGSGVTVVGRRSPELTAVGGGWLLRLDGPAINRVGRVPLPLASTGIVTEAVQPVRLDHSNLSFVHNRRAIVSLSRVWGDVRIRQAASGHTAGLHPNYHLGAVDLAQTEAGQMLVWHPDNEAPREYPCTPKPWPEPPVAIERDRFLLPDDGAVLLFDAKAGKELARYTIPGDESLSGELPRFRVQDGGVLVLIDRNHGAELDRLILDGLKRVWDRSPIFVGRELGDVTFDGDRFFTAADGMLTAHDWKTGARLWDVPLPDAPHTRWRLSVSRQGLLVHPAESLMLNPRFDAVGEFRRAGWNRARLLRALDRSYDAWTARELPLLVIDPADGRLVQRLTFPAVGPAAGVAVTPKGVVVVTGKGSWTLK